ncbi:MAG: hypothetical protein AAFO96_02600 [Bacteroidota bacterium]
MDLQLINAHARGTSQEGRKAYHKALFPGYFELDDQSFESYIEFLYELSFKLNFYDEQDQIQEEGGWNVFFEHNVRVALAMMIKVKFSRIWQKDRQDGLQQGTFEDVIRHLQTLSKLDLAVDHDALRQVIGININLIHELFTWYTHIHHPQFQQLLLQYIETAIQKPLEILAKSLDQIYQETLMALVELKLKNVEQELLSLAPFRRLLQSVMGELLLETLNQDEAYEWARRLVKDFVQVEVFTLKLRRRGIYFEDLLADEKALIKDQLIAYIGHELIDFIHQSLQAARLDELQMPVFASAGDQQVFNLRLEHLRLIHEFKQLYEGKIKHHPIWVGPESEGEDDLRAVSDLTEKLDSYFELLGLKDMSFDHPSEEAPTLEAHCRVLLLKTADDFVDVIEIFRSFAQERLAPEFVTPDHAPQMGLMYAFWELWEKYHQPVYNHLPYRHGKFYFEEVLRLQPKEEEPDHAYIAYELIPGSLGSKIPAHSVLTTAPGPDGVIHAFTTSHDQYLTTAKVADIKTLCIQAEKEEDTTQPIFASLHADSLDGKGLPFPDPAQGSWYPFGKNQEGIIESERFMEPARLGFVLGSPQLLSLGGQAILTLNFYLQDTEDVNIRFQGLQEPLSSDMLRVYLSTAEGWLEIGDKKIQLIDSPCESKHFPSETDRMLVMELPISRSFPPVVPMPANLSSEGISSEFPLLKVEVTPSFQYLMLRKSTIRRIEVEMEVSHLQLSSLYNDYGPLDATQPFQPFGVIPSQGANFYIGNAEAFSKPLDSLDLHIEWMDPPQNPEGLEGYYRSYNVDFEAYKKQHRAGISPEIGGTQPDLPSTGKYRDETYQLEMAYLSEYGWKDTSSSHPLFEHTPISQKIHTQRVLSFHDLPLQFDTRHGKSQGTEPLRLEENPAGGFIRLQLVTPPEAFGHKVYPLALAEAIRFNAIKSNENHPAPLPLEPYTPTIKSLHLSYKSTLHYDFGKRGQHSDVEFFHLSPFGYQTAVNSDIYPAQLFLFPHFTHKGNLFIGLQDIQPPAHVDLLIQVEPDSFEADGHVPPIEWQYLVDDEWVDFHPNSVTMDREVAFIVDSVIGFDLPSDMSLDHHIMPTGFLWIKASTFPLGGATEKEDTSIAAFSKLKGIYPNGTRVTRTLQSHGAMEPLPPLSIQKITGNFPSILKILQPAPTFGGKVSEEEEHYMIRVAERLRHKNRAISPWDIERMVLEAFPYIQEAKCIRNPHTPSLHQSINHPYQWGQGGAVQVVVVPKPSEKYTRKPRLSSFELLEIQKYLQKYASPMAEIEVINPRYEEVKVILGLGIPPGSNGSMISQKLDKALQEFLSPWPYDAKSTAFLTDIPLNAIIGFIQDQHLVEEIREVVVLHFYEEAGEKKVWEVIDESPHPEDTGTMVKPSHSASVLISSHSHMITTQYIDESLPGSNDKEPTSMGGEEGTPSSMYHFFGIGHMEVGESLFVDPRDQISDKKVKVKGMPTPTEEAKRRLIFFK